MFTHDTAIPGDDDLAVALVEKIDLDLDELAEPITMLDLEQRARDAQVDYPAPLPFGLTCGPDSCRPCHFLPLRAIGVLRGHRDQESKIRCSLAVCLSY